MQNKFKIIDESGDRKYFTLIPNYIVNHSTPYEQAIYLYMKRRAGENGTCWSSAQEIANHLDISRNTVAKYRDKLLKRGWIKEVGQKRIGATNQPVNEYKIVDLWKKNVDYYENLKKGSTDESFHQMNERVQQVNLKVSPVGLKEEPLKKNPKEELIKYKPESLKLAKLLYQLIKDQNPNWHVKPNWDQWAEDIDKIIRIDKRTYEQVKWMIRWAQDDSFWKTNILSPAKLRKQFNTLVIQAKAKQPKVAIIR